jgi:hypothetical protein
MRNPIRSTGSSPTKKPASNSNHSIQQFEFYATLGIDRKGQGGNHGNQFGRRNLSPYERTRLALRLEEAIKERAKANMVKGTNQHSPKQNSAEASNPIETREEIAKLAGVSRARNHGAGHERRDRRHRGVESLLQPDCVWRRTGMGRLFRIKAV